MHTQSFPKLAFFDLDGTLVNAAGEVVPSAIEAVKKLRDRGVRIAFATGRPYFGAAGEVKKLGIDQGSLFFAGALGIIPGQEKVIFESIIPEPAARLIHKKLRTSGFYYEWYTRDGYAIEADNRYAKIHSHYLGSEPVLAPLQSSEDYNRLLKFVIVAEDDEQENRVRSLIRDTPGIRLSIGTGAAHPHLRFINVTNEGASREKAFERLCAHHGVTQAEVVAFGDAEADIPFLQCAGWSVAMGEAPEHVKRAAKFVTRGINEDGIAHAIHKLIEITQ